MAPLGTLIYGSNGDTGRLIVARAMERGLRPMLAGRNARDEGEANAIIESVAYLEQGASPRRWGTMRSRAPTTSASSGGMTNPPRRTGTS